MIKNLFKHYLTKLKHILPSYFYIILGTVILMLSFRWLFSIQSEILLIKEEYYKIWIPLILPWIPITIWLRPKLRILKFKNPSRDTFGHQAIVWITMGAILMISNHFLTESTAKFEKLSTIEDLNNARYISLDYIALNKEFGSSHAEFSISGKYNQHFNFDIYFVYPFKSDNILTHWYGKKYHKQISNKLSTLEKEREFKSFFKNSAKQFETFRYYEPNYFEVLTTSNKREGFVNAVHKADVYTPDKLIIIEPQKGNYTNDSSTSFYWIFGAFGIGFSIFLMVLIFPGYNKKEHTNQLKGIKPKSDDLVDMLKFLIPRDDHYATSIIINLNLLVFITMVIFGVSFISPSALELLELGGNRRTEILNGGWWRLVTNIFLHGGFMHLLLNIYGLVIAAMFIEPNFGRKNYFIIYFVSGVCASLASIYWYENTVSVGASGAIFGLYGALFGLLLTDVMPKESRKTIFFLLGPYVGINLLFGFTEGIDNAAHIGGLLSGFIVGLVCFRLDKNLGKHSY
jgi:rhomboid protease GluP